MKKKIVLFVCNGNTCRSVMAQGLFTKLRDKLNPKINYEADSAGIMAIEGISPNYKAFFCMNKLGIDISNYLSKPISREIIDDASIILTMTYHQRDFLMKIFPAANNKIFLFRIFCNKNHCIENQEIEDPYGETTVFYKDICYQLKQDIERLLIRIEGE